MKAKLILIAWFVLPVVLATGCAGQPAAAANNPEPRPTEAQPVMEMTGLVDALRAAGAIVEPDQPVQQPFLTVGGDILKVNGADVQIFEYETPEALEADAAQVSPDGGSIGTSMVSWMEPPHFFKAGRILVLYVGQDQAILDLLKSVLGPQFAGG